jgi:alcohol dehydrogenase
MPKMITAGTGMDAFAHCLEAYSSPFYPPDEPGHRARGHAAGQGEPALAPRRRHRHRGARGDDGAAAMGAVAFQKGLGAIHALSHPVGAVYNTHHGMTNAVVMPPVLKMNRPAIEDRIAAGGGLSWASTGGFDGFYDFVARSCSARPRCSR